MVVCSVEGCSRQNMARGLCRMHYMRAMRSKSLPPPIKWPTLYERLHRHYTKRSENECWEWSGAASKQGYGNIGSGRKVFLAHRVMWEYAHEKSVPPGMVVMHTCDNPPCVNPAHLKLGTFAENIKDRVYKGRSARMQGAEHPRAKLTDSDVRHIRNSSLDQHDLAKLYRVSTDTIYEIRVRKTWKHLD